VKHKAHPDFWQCYNQLNASIQRLADKNFELLKTNPRHPSLQLKKVGSDLYSARVGLEHRAAFPQVLSRNILQPGVPGLRVGLLHQGKVQLSLRPAMQIDGLEVSPLLPLQLG
jgi:hypothetical protein